MNEVFEYLAERQAEFTRHMSVARLLESRVDNEIGEESEQIEVRHINTIKSGLLVHLYNIVEAVTTRTLAYVGQTIVTEQPKLWTEPVLKEWVRSAVWDRDNLAEPAVAKLAGISRRLASGESLDTFKVKGVPGSWTDKAIKEVAARLGCHLQLSVNVRRKTFEKAYQNETTAMQYLARQRNALAHGEATFEDGAQGRTLDQIAELADRILPFLREVALSYQMFLESKSYLAPQDAAA